MSKRTYSLNAYESSIASGISAAATEIQLTSAAGLRAPGYLVLEPDSVTKREYFKFTGISTNTLTGCTRGLTGSAAGAEAHDAGAVVRAVAMHQWLDDIYDDIEDLEAFETAHTGATTTTAHPEATTSTRGFLSAADKTKLDGLAAAYAAIGHDHDSDYSADDHYHIADYDAVFDTGTIQIGSGSGWVAVATAPAPSSSGLALMYAHVLAVPTVATSSIDIDLGVGPSSPPATYVRHRTNTVDFNGPLTVVRIAPISAGTSVKAYVRVGSGADWLFSYRAAEYVMLQTTPQGGT